MGDFTSNTLTRFQGELCPWGRADGIVAEPVPHRPERTRLTHPDPRMAGSLKERRSTA